MTSAPAAPRYRRAARTPGDHLSAHLGGESRRPAAPRPVLEAGQALLEEPLAPLRDDLAPAAQPRGDLVVAQPLCGHQHHLSPHHLPIRQRIRTRQRLQHRALLVAQLDPIRAMPWHQRPLTRGQDATHATAETRTLIRAHYLRGGPLRLLLEPRYRSFVGEKSMFTPRSGSHQAIIDGHGSRHPFQEVVA